MKKLLIYLFPICFLFCLFVQIIWADNFNVYTDYGIPEDTELWTWGSDVLYESTEDPSTPEGVCYGRTQDDSWGGWGVFYPSSSIDLSNYASGELKFYVSSNLDLSFEIEDSLGTVSSFNISSYGWDGTDSWQEITVPVGDFTGIDLSSIYAPFKVTAGSTCDFSIDNVHWTVPISGYTPTQVEFVSNELLVNGVSTIVRGVSATMSPVGYDYRYDWSVHPEYYDALDFPLMEDMYANTIRIYKPVTTADSLDSANNHGLYVIMGFNIEGSKVTTAEGRAYIQERFLEMVEHWKDHPAILMWCFGNEVVSSLDYEEDISNWYTLLNDCAQAAKAIDPNHPVITSVSDIDTPDDNLVTNLDAWGLNIYRGDTFGTLFTDWMNATTKPLIITEFGCDRFDARIGISAENPQLQRVFISSQLNEIRDNLVKVDPSKRCVGGCVFAWCDQWWKNESLSSAVHDPGCDWYNEGYLALGVDPYMNEEWWGIIAISDTNPYARYRKGAYFKIRSKYQQWSLL